MQYGYFDAHSREYVITRPDTPAPWANYLGSPEYGAIITNNAGGYSFVKSGAAGRILRYRFNEEDRPGRYIYLRDDETGDYWSATWQPVAKDLKAYQAECRHGTGYTLAEAAYGSIKSQAAYYVPHRAAHEVWNLSVTNTGNTARKLSVFGYAEFTNDSNYEQDQVNMQYTLFITRTYFKGSYILQTINENCVNAVNNNAKASRFFGLAGAKASSFCGDRESFIGNYHDYRNPQAVEAGKCDGQLNYNMNGCGALHTEVALEPGETKTFSFLLGQKEIPEAEALIARYNADSSLPQKEIAVLKVYWHSKLDTFKVKTPDEDFNHMINTWNAYQCFTTFVWSRAASLIYCGQRNGYGYRDTVQDIQGIIHLAPEMAKKQIRFMLGAQVHHGGALPLVKYDHNAGHENSPEDDSYVRQTGHPSYRADDALWLFPTVYKYIAETGDLAFLDERIPFANKDEATVYGHLLRAVSFSLEHSGIYDLPAGLHADWNDCLRLGAQGVSVFVAFQLYYAFTIMRQFAEARKDNKALADMQDLQAKFGRIIEEHCWDGDWFVRGIAENGEVVGCRANPEASFWLNPQSWAVISGYAKGSRAEGILNLVRDKLNTPYGVRIMAPSYKEHPFEGALALLFNPSTKENGSIFLQTQGWIILAEALMGRGNRAFEYYKESCPAAQNGIAEIRKLEPYVYGQFTESVESSFEGRSNVHWLTGTASTVMVGCVEGILGIRPDLRGLALSPAIPSDWKEVTIDKQYQGRRLRIRVTNPHGRDNAAQAKLTVNGDVMQGNYIPNTALKAENEVVLEL
ncbi:MAG: N,N'-diacetylchitobiose phosphorylase [Treponema sp.]|jgi:cellobiose phosphorylase|nr:N,N'-diacetylchitobiose phosphorylase [Treponema sp.]